MTKRLVAAAAVLRTAHLRALPADIRVCAVSSRAAGQPPSGCRHSQLRTAPARYTTAMVCHHRQGQIVQKGRQSWLEKQ